MHFPRARRRLHWNIPRTDSEWYWSFTCQHILPHAVIPNGAEDNAHWIRRTGETSVQDRKCEDSAICVWKTPRARALCRTRVECCHCAQRGLCSLWRTPNCTNSELSFTASKKFGFHPGEEGPQSLHVQNISSPILPSSKGFPRKFVPND